MSNQGYGRNPYWAPEFTGQKPSFNDMGAFRLNKDHPLNQGLVAWWIFNEGAGNKCYSAVGNNIFDDLTGCTLNRYGLLNADGQWAACNNPKIPAIGTGPYCLFIELIPSAFRANTGIFSFGAYDPAWAFNSEGKPYIYDGGAKTAGDAALIAKARGTLCFNRISTGAGATEQYVNGVATTAATHADSITAPAVMSIGSDRDSNQGVEFIGTIISASLHLRSLSAAEILKLHYYPYGTTSNPRFIVQGARTYFIPASGGGATPIPLDDRGVLRGISRGTQRGMMRI